MSQPTSTDKVRIRDAEATREKLLKSALDSFSTRGFDASSTRQIEEDAGVKRGLINYHFGSKQELWEATAGHIMGVAAMELREAIASADNADEKSRLRYFVRAYVRFCARHPEVNRLMIQEGMREDWRLKWLVEHAVRPWYHQVCDLFAEAKRLGVAPGMEEHTFYYILTGAATLVFSNAAEARLLTDKNTLDEDEVSHHADAVAAMLFPEKSQ